MNMIWVPVCSARLCVNACPHDAITFDQNFEHAVFDRAKLVLKLNHDGSKVIEKKKKFRYGINT